MIDSNYNQSIEQAVEWIRDSGALLVCAGAGMGVDSGLPDFRGNQGFWKAYPPFAKLGYSFIDMANPQWFERDPRLAWGFYGHRMNLYRKTVPHNGYNLLVEWGRAKPGGYFVFTSNVDGQFQKAGYDDDCVSECHGSIHHMQCTEPCTDVIWDGSGIPVSVNGETMRAEGDLPECPRCGALARPNILMFGDWLWLGRRTEAQHQRMNEWLFENRDNGITIVECGAGTGVPTVRMTSESIVNKFNARLIRVNVREPQVPRGQIGLPLGALEVLELISKSL